MDQAFEPAYLKLYRSGELKKRVEEVYERLEACDICPRECEVNRRESAKGAVCRTGERAVVSSFNPHFGQEAPLAGRGGSGTIFFSWCNLKCQYCQDYEISQLGHGREVEPKDLETQRSFDEVGGRHNIKRMGLSVAAIYSTATAEYRYYTEENVNDLIEELKAADLVVGFNVLSFDYEVLRSYTDYPLKRLPTVDMLTGDVSPSGFSVRQISTLWTSGNHHLCRLCRA